MWVGVPSAPLAPAISEVSSGSVLVSWSAPTKDGGAPLLGYHVERRSSTAKRWVFVTREMYADTTLRVTDLFPDTEYEFRVSAENSVGTGPPSQPSLPLTTRDPWGEWQPCTHNTVES